LEMKAKKSVNVSGATQVVSYDKLSYEVKSDAVKFFAKSHDVISTEEYSKKCIEYIKSFCSNNQDFAKKYNIGAIVGDIESKSFHNTADFGYSTGLLNAPLVLDILVEVLQGSVIRQYATTRLSNSIKVEMPSFENIGEAEWVGPAQQRLQQQTVAFADLKSVTAAHAASPISLTQSLKEAASNNMPLIQNVLGGFLRNNVYTKFEGAYCSEGISIVGGGSIEGIVPAVGKQFEYDFADPKGAYQFQKNKLAFVKSGNATDPTSDTILDLRYTLPQGTPITFMAHSSMVRKIKRLKDDNGNYIVFNGNGLAVANARPDTIDGMNIVINDRLPVDVAVYGDIARSYTIVDCFGGFKMLDRPAVELGLIDNMIGSAYSTGMITNYQLLRLYKLAI